LKLDDIASDVKVYQRVDDAVGRPAVAVDLGVAFLGALLPHADPSHASTLADGVKARMGKILPEPKVDRAVFLNGLKDYTLRWIKRRNIQKLSYSFDGNFEEWLALTNYEAWRKDELRKKKEEISYMLERNEHGKLIHFMIKLFMKDEHYIDFKHARGIYARDDGAKIAFGPWFKAIEHEIYSQPEFIKHVPVRLRPKYIYDRLFSEGSTYVATDYSSFEAHFDAELMAHCEFVLYEYMLSDANGGSDILNVMHEVLRGENLIFNKFVTARCIARRMSGEMNTSLGNGFSNLMFMGYVCELLGLEVNGVVEGDDGLFQFSGTHPITADFSKYGFSIKLDTYTKISDASFCGNLFDEDSLQIVTDPLDVICSIGWTTHRYRHSNLNTHKTLLRAKALSMAHQYPGCPIVGKLAQYCLRVTRGRTNRDMIHSIERNRSYNMWERDSIKEAINFRTTDEDLYVDPTIGTRLLCEKLYGITVQTQLLVEKYLDSLVTMQHLDFPLLLDLMPLSWKTYFEEFVVPLDKCPEAFFGEFKTIHPTK